MGYDDTTLHDFVAARYPELRRSAFLMCGDWSRADEQTRLSLAHLIDESHRSGVDDFDAYVYSHLMAAFQHRPGRREHVFVAAPDAPVADSVETVLVLDALHKLTPRCRAVVVLRHWEGFEVEETADVLGLPDELVEAYDAAGLTALAALLGDPAESAR